MRSRVAVGVGLCVLVCGCFAKKPADKQRYLLAPVAPAAESGERAPAVDAIVKLERVRISPLYDSKGFVYKTGRNRYETDFYHEFYTTPGLAFEEALLVWLRADRTFSGVLTAQDPQWAPWALSVRIDEVYGDASERGETRAVIAMTVALREVSAGLRVAPLMTRRYSAATPVPSRGAHDLLDGWSRGLSDMLVELRSDLRAVAGSFSPGP